MSEKLKYRIVSRVSEEGFEFSLVMRYVAYFITNVMKAQVRYDGPDTLIKYTRDWEYPWILSRSEVRPGSKALDCGSGYSPVPFLWSEYGAEAHAIDRDVMIIGRIPYIVIRLIGILLDIVKMPFFVLTKLIRKKDPASDRDEAGARTGKGQTGNIPCSGVTDMRFRARFRRYFAHLTIKYRYEIRRMWKSDFWGPIPPALLKRFKVKYQKGDLTKLPYPDEYFDVVSCVSVLEHMSRSAQIKGIREMARVLRKKGRLLITYDLLEGDLTDVFLDAAAMTPIELVYFHKPAGLYTTDEPQPDVIGMCLDK